MVRAISGVIVLIVVFGLFVSAAAAAAEMKCEGTIIKIEGENVTVMGAAKEYQMKIEPGTMITSAGKPVSPMDLKVGQKVKCVLDRRGEEMICTMMELMRDTP